MLLLKLLCLQTVVCSCMINYETSNNKLHFFNLFSLLKSLFHELCKSSTCKSILELIAEMYAQPHFIIQTVFFKAQEFDKFHKLYPFFRFLILFIFILQINLGIYVEDNKTEFSVLVDRPIGGSSLQDGQIELMVHRYVLFFK